jgi:hypothetical protein
VVDETGTLRQGLAIQLEESPFLKIMDDAQLQRDLRLMNLHRAERALPIRSHTTSAFGKELRLL